MWFIEYFLFWFLVSLAISYKTTPFSIVKAYSTPTPLNDDMALKHYYMTFYHYYMTLFYHDIGLLQHEMALLQHEMALLHHVMTLEHHVMTSLYNVMRLYITTWSYYITTRRYKTTAWRYFLMPWRYNITTWCYYITSWRYYMAVLFYCSVTKCHYIDNIISYSVNITSTNCISLDVFFPMTSGTPKIFRAAEILDVFIICS